MKISKFGAFMLFVCFAVFACSQNENTRSNAVNVNKNPGNETAAQPTATIDEMVSAKKIYTEQCARCHIKDGSSGKTEIDGKTVNAENLLTENQK